LVLRDELMQRAAVDVFHPQTDAIVDPLGPVDGDDVWVTDACEQPAFLDDRRFHLAGLRPVDRHQLERDLPVQARVPRPVHVPEGALPDLLEQP
jgi:hypothetical protein